MVLLFESCLSNDRFLNGRTETIFLTKPTLTNEWPYSKNAGKLSICGGIIQNMIEMMGEGDS